MTSTGPYFVLSNNLCNYYIIILHKLFIGLSYIAFYIFILFDCIIEFILSTIYSQYLSFSFINTFYIIIMYAFILCQIIIVLHCISINMALHKVVFSK